MIKLMITAIAVAAFAFGRAPAAEASAGLTKHVKLGDTVTVRTGRANEAIRARAYDFRPPTPIDRAPSTWRATVRIDMRLVGRRPLSLITGSTVHLLNEVERRTESYVSTTAGTPSILRLAPGKLRGVTVAFTVGKDPTVWNMSVPEPVAYLEFSPGLSSWLGPRDRARWTLPHTGVQR
jgi:hypothetical protein